jgi:K+-transporting ATPase ATPase C chain
VKYHSGPQKGKLAGPDIEAWFQQDRVNDKPGIVAQWANLHNTVAQNWIKTNNDPVSQKVANGYVALWHRTHDKEVKQWLHDNPDTSEPKPDDADDQSPLAVPFFTSYAQQYPGTFPTIVEKETADKRKEKVIERVKTGSDIQGHFFDMWLTAHPEADLERVPGDMLTTSGSGLDPHITLDNALWQLDRVVTARAGTSGKEADIRGKINHLLLEKQIKPLGGLVGVPLINVLEINLEIDKLLGG